MGIVRSRANGRGRLEAFDSFVLRHQDMVYNVSYRLLGEEQLAAQAAFDTFARSFSAFAGFRDGSARLWLLRVVTDLCRARLRRGPPLNAELLSASDPIQECLALLPPEQRITLVLADVQGLTYREVADATGVPVGIVSSRLSDGRTALRNALLARGWLEPEHPDRMMEGQAP